MDKIADILLMEFSMVERILYILIQISLKFVPKHLLWQACYFFNQWWYVKLEQLERLRSEITPMPHDFPY